MMKRTQAMRKVIALILGCTVCLPSLAQAAQERKSPLTDAPVIRKRLELRDKRVEIGIGAAVTIGQDFYNALLITPRLAFHFTDWIALGVFGGFNATPGWKSSFQNDLSGALSTVYPHTPPTAAEAKSPLRPDGLATMNHIGWVAGGQVEFLPLAGKIALFSAVFSYFDFYVFGGAAAVNLARASGPLAGCEASGACKAYTATEIAGNAGAGAHAYINNYTAINLEIRDLIYKNNASGRDVNGDSITNSADLEWTSNWIFGLNLQFFLPPKAKISR
jgi:outer membrane beta-barrel protein